jgi:sugar phosphate isomerase/epimerase
MPSNQEVREAARSGVVVSRRAWLGAAAAAAVAGATAPAWAADVRTKARQNFRLGVAGQVYAHLPLAEAARRMQADGFCAVLSDYRYADVRFDPLAPDWPSAEKIVTTLERHGILICAMHAYYNVVDPDARRRQIGEARMEALLKHWKRLGCAVVSTETGTFNTRSEWAESPENDTEEGYRKCRAAIERWVRLAEKTGAVVSIEPYWRNVIGTIDRAERLLRELSSPSLKLVMDPCNYFRREDLPRMRPMLEEMFRRLGREIVVAHAKDVKGSAQGTDLPAAGLGELDYPVFLRLLAELDRPLPVLLEHLAIDDVPRDRAFLARQIERLP